jgi:abhydrolase domain-containing protein 6
MPRTLRPLALAALVLLSLGVAAYHLVPGPFVAPLVAANRGLAGLAPRHVWVGAHEVHYLEGGTGVPVVLLHGLFADKDHWTGFSAALTPHHRVVAPDLPGFGDSTRLADADYAYDAQVERLHAFTRAVGLERFHLAGNSMGGALAALYAARHPEQVLSVGLIGAPHGLSTPEPSAFDLEIREGRRPLVVTTRAEFERMVDRMFVRRPFVPGPVLAHLAARATRDVPGDVRLWDAHRAEGAVLDGLLPRLTVPSFSLWGAEDRVFHVSGAARLQVLLPGHVGRVLPGVGHLPMMEQPAETGALYRDFLAGLRTPGVVLQETQDGSKRVGLQP